MADEKAPKTFNFTTAERGYLQQLIQVASQANAQVAAANEEVGKLVADAKQRLGLPPEAQLVPDAKRGVFILVEAPAEKKDPAPTIDLAAERAKANGTAEPVGAPK